MRFVGLALCAMFLACEDINELHPVDGDPCALDADGNIVLGEDAALEITCHLGWMVYTRQEDGTYSEMCVGSWLPTPEYCDSNVNADGRMGEDEDCDGEANNIFYPALSEGNPCVQTEEGVCKISTYECQMGQMVCVPPVGLYNSEEQCDYLGLDENCNGSANQDDPTLQMDHPEFQYNGPPETLNYGLCRAGHWECIEGQEILRGEIEPTDEICSSGQDEDCDGLTDESDNPFDATAFVIELDVSGSMGDTIEAVHEALCGWASGEILQNSVFAIEAVGIDGFDPENQPPYIEKITDFVSAADACTSLSNWMATNYGGGTELFPYGIWALDNDPTGQISIQWPDGMDRRVIAFTDEEPQSYQAGLEQEETNMIDSCTENDFTVGFFVPYSMDYMWSDMAHGCGGWIESLSSDPEQMQDKLKQRFGGEC